ncbi:ChbG/HpnK family deacetylase [candidate division KSB1 bacterium]|nr:ChbG/HpnK family deacetylase [candidate division KSB1 bacterium]RQW06299.1 MAG: ChbG/HpnK family deacetylase [candidate division KSB1 bacterium]
MKKYLIVNADDFGRSLEVNRGIVHVFKNGIVTSTTLLVNFDAFADAVDLIKRFHIPVGIHFNLTDGRPVCSPSLVPSLVDSQGQFFRKFVFYRRLLKRRFRAQDIERELRAQLNACLNAGIELDHYDGHHHVHALKGVAHICRSLGQDIQKLPLRRISWPHACQSALSKIQQSAIHLFEDKRRTAAELRTTFWGFDFMDQQNKHEAFNAMLDNLQPGIHEMMCHPGFESPEYIGYYNAQREREIDVLCDTKIAQKIKELQIELVSYRNLSHDHTLQ